MIIDLSIVIWTIDNHCAKNVTRVFSLSLGFFSVMRFIRQVQVLSRRFQSAIAQSSNASNNANLDPKIVTIVDQISKLNLIETAKLVDSLKVIQTLLMISRHSEFKK